MKIKYIVTSHTNPHLSGVAKFNQCLAKRLKVPCVRIEDVSKIKKGPVLLSLKLSDHNKEELTKTKDAFVCLINNKIVYDIFLHAFTGHEIEYEIFERCRQAFCANDEIAHVLSGFDKSIINAWCPSLLKRETILHESKLNLFSFGMAHKIQVKHYKRLYGLLNKHAIDYSLWVSTAFHEKVSFGDFDLVSNQLAEIYKERICFLGFLSDEAVNYFLDKTNVFVAFFEKGLRANNTSVLATMKRGCCVLTNVDEHSPQWLAHGVNILDIDKAQPKSLDLKTLKRIGQQAAHDVERYASWEHLVRLITLRSK